MSVPSWVQNVNLAATPRKHLQDIAKMHGIKANVKTAEIVEQLEAIKSTLLNQRAPANIPSKASKQTPASPVFSPGRCATASSDAKSPPVSQPNFGSSSKQMSSGRSDRGRKRDRYSIDSVSSDVLRQASDVAAELMNMSPRDALDLSVSDEEDDDLKEFARVHVFRNGVTPKKTPRGKARAAAAAFTLPTSTPSKPNASSPLVPKPAAPAAAKTFGVPKAFEGLPITRAPSVPVVAMPKTPTSKTPTSSSVFKSKATAAASPRMPAPAPFVFTAGSSTGTAVAPVKSIIPRLAPSGLRKPGFGATAVKSVASAQPAAFQARASALKSPIRPPVKLPHITPTRPKTPAGPSRTAPTPTAKSPFPAKSPAAPVLPSKSPFASKSPAPHPVFRVGSGSGSAALVPTPAVSYAAQAKSRTGFSAANLKDIRHANSFAASASARNAKMAARRQLD